MSFLINNPIAAFREGGEEGFTYFFNAYYKPLYFFAFSYLKDEAASEDIVSESFIKVWSKREKFEREGGVKSYLYKCVYTGCMKEMRSEK
jgi:RNA polymerase sigma factor (sigma-70 family)